MPLQVLVIDDESQVREFVSQVLEDEGWRVTQADSAERAFEMLLEREWAAVFCDIVLGGVDGFSVLRRFKEELPQTKVILMTGHGSAAGALDATAFGAYDYLLKPFGLEQLRSVASAVSECLITRPRRVQSNKRLTSIYDSPVHLIGRSAVFIDVMKQVGRVAATNLPVLLTGESGTGKELIASALHQRGERSEKRFVAVNCGAIPSELIESELFGHVRGSFTGADRDRRGLWEEADGGTVFLDEITETTLTFQVKLLRALQEGEIRRVGANANQKVDVRVVAASNRDVEAEVKAGRFRQDLFYRLNAVSIVLPPLRERPEDIMPLAKSFADKLYALSPTVAFSPEALSLLKGYSWPGNIRELENAVIRAAAMCYGTIRPQDLPERIRNYQAEMVRATHEGIDTADFDVQENLRSLAEVEARYVKQVLEHTRGNKQGAARILAVDIKTLKRMIKRHKINEEEIALRPSRAA